MVKSLWPRFLLAHLYVTVRASVFLLVITVSCAKTDELIEMPFGVGTRVEPRNRVSVGAWITVQCKGQFLKVDISWPTVKYREHPASAEVIRHVATAMRPSAVSTAATCFYFIGLGRSDPSLNMSKGSRLVCDAIASLLHYVLLYPSSVVCRLMEFF